MKTNCKSNFHYLSTNIKKLFKPSDSPTTTEGHRLFATTRCCNYSLLELLMMGECFTRNM
jgi:hypothetical protein